MPGLTKFMASASSSSGPVSDALANLTRAATAAFTTVQDQAQADVATARAERDDAVKALHEAQLDAKDLEMREAGWRASLEKADITIKHQAETIAQLRNEVDQWKTQLTRLEDTSRQEIDGWKDQYRRAEHERGRLSVRIDELMAGQLAWNVAAHAYPAPYTPRVAYAEIAEASSSSSGGTKRASTVSGAHRERGTPHRNARLPQDDDVEVPPPPVRKSKTAGAQTPRSVPQTDHERAPKSPARQPTSRRKEAVSGANPRASGSRPAPRTTASRPTPARRESQATAEPQQKVIRHVTAIVNVKEEEQDEDDLGDADSALSGSVYDTEDDVPPALPSRKRRRTSNASARRKQIIPDWDEDEQTPDVGNDTERCDAALEDEDEDDELLLAPQKPAVGHVKQARVGGTRKPAGSKNLKRKIEGDTSMSSGRAGPTKTPKTR
ncbi:hypothetical protein C8Q78DRAFT_1042550 [Trametes maxima]|nr:hypothetical protein C8Q78DRAFT_1042550 [Trametes maxima]